MLKHFSGDDFYNGEEQMPSERFGVWEMNEIQVQWPFQLKEHWS